MTASPSLTNTERHTSFTIVIKHQLAETAQVTDRIFRARQQCNPCFACSLRLLEQIQGLQNRAFSRAVLPEKQRDRRQVELCRPAKCFEVL
jgi:hypothetical protein